MVEAQKNVLEVEDTYLRTKFAAMYEAAIVVWVAREGDGLESMPTEAKVDSFIAHMDAVSKEKEFTRFWWHNFMSTYGLLYMILREAIHRADALDIEVVVRKAVPLFTFTHQHADSAISCPSLSPIQSHCQLDGKKEPKCGNRQTHRRPSGRKRRRQIHAQAGLE